MDVSTRGLSLAVAPPIPGPVSIMTSRIRRLLLNGKNLRDFWRPMVSLSFSERIPMLMVKATYTATTRIRDLLAGRTKSRPGRPTL
jgi:hypothetical protein